MSLFPHWMAAVAQAFSQWIGSWVARDIPAFRECSRVVSAQSWATVRGTMVRGPDGQNDSWLQVYTNHPAVGNVMGWPREVLPVFQQPVCGLPILAVAVVLDVGTLWLYDRQLRRAIPAVTGRRSMAVLVGSKQLSWHGYRATTRSATSRKPCSLCQKGTNTWLPMPNTPLTP